MSDVVLQYIEQMVFSDLGRTRKGIIEVLMSFKSAYKTLRLRL
jgi:hypothetical protein